MANYNVYMGQGITIPNLTENMLLTGAGRDTNLVSSCSVVILINTANWAVGLYHFPAGSINSDQHSKDVIRNIALAVAPNRAYIGYGVIGMIPTNTDGVDSAQWERGGQLISYVLTQVPNNTRLTRIAARTGIVSVTCNAGNVVLGDQVPSNIVHLRTVAAGSHGTYTLYGHAM